MSDTTELNLESYLPTFGLAAFREGQREVIEAVLAGRDSLCVMPTGGGKSLCYQLPAMVLDGLTLVVSPLIALMKDQVDQLLELELPVSFINSTLPIAEQHERLDRMAAGEFRMVYVVPERFRSGRFLDAVRAVGLKMLAVDEAHCISEWGHDFRPDYARLGHFRRLLGRPTTIALTATATDQVRRDIVEQLDLREPRTFITGFARPNLHYEVLQPSSEHQKADMLIRFLGQTPGAGIIYASTRKRTEEVAETVARQTRRTTGIYHAGLLPEARRAAQENFMGGKQEIVVATNAFGMGIDKADVRFVVHYNLPGTLEAYYQEAGRAGRDGEPSRCLLLYSASDRFIQEFFIESAYPAREHVEAVYDHLRSLDEDPIELTQEEVKRQTGLPIGTDGVGNCEQLLEGAGALERLVAAQNMAMVRLDSDLPTLVDLLPKRAKVRRRVLQAVERLVGPRRNELVHLRPHDLDVDVEPGAATHALRQLNELGVVTYVPPFRGRAIRMIEREKPFDDLEIDFDVLLRRKQAEYDKLKRVIRFAVTSQCRQQQVLHYFGERSAETCGHCDNCDQTGADPDRPAGAAIDGKVLEAVRMVLSGVARTDTQLNLPCGKNLIAQMLCGSNSARMKKLRLNQLSTFGLLQHLTQPEAVALIDGLIAIDLLQQVEIEPMRPVVQLTDAGAEVMRASNPPDDELPIPPYLLSKLRGEATAPPPDRQSESPQDMPEVEPGLLATLQQWRREAAAKVGLPLFHILTNATLDGLAAYQPQSADALLEIKGIGPTKLTRYGDELLELIRAATHGEPAAPAEDVPALREQATEVSAGVTDGPTSVRPSHYWTWRLLSAGFSPEECAAIRGVDHDVVLDHALRALDDGLEMQSQWCLAPWLHARLEEIAGDAGPQDARSLLSQLPDGARYEEVLLYLRCRARDGD